MCIAGWFQPLCGLAVVLAGETIGKNIVDIAHGPHIFIRPHTAARSMTARILIAPAADLPANTGDRSGEETDVTHGLPRPHPPRMISKLNSPEGALGRCHTHRPSAHHQLLPRCTAWNQHLCSQPRDALRAAAAQRRRGRPRNPTAQLRLPQD